jgi:two-component system sensor histidine kinase UhpB
MAVSRSPGASFRCVGSLKRYECGPAAAPGGVVDATGAVISTKDVLGTAPFAWRIFAVNAVLLVAAAVALALSPATVSFPIALTEGIVLAVGLIAILIVNLLLVRRSFAPLERLTRLMRSVDLLRPGQRVDVTGPQEVRELGAVFNEMLERLERERHVSGWDALKTQETERKRVAQELHDEVGQALTAVMLQIGRLAKKAPSDLGDELSEALETTRSSLEDVRRIAKQLRPEALDDLGLVPALNALASAFAERTGLRIRRRLPERMPSIGDEAELVVFRVAQESLTNAARHAQSTRVDLTLERSGRRVVLHVRDYGRGIDGIHPGSGIRGMRERALLIGAELSIANAPGGGTDVSLSLPVTEPR